MGGGALRALWLWRRCAVATSHARVSSPNASYMLLYMLHSDMERMRVGGGLTAGRSQHPDQVPVVERLGAAASAGVRVLYVCWAAL